MQTYFASPDRATISDLKDEIEKTQNLPLVIELSYLISDPFIILNPQRQIVYCNASLSQLLKLADPSEIYGKRPGEALNCLHSMEQEGGCGTTESCKYCGAVNAIVSSQESVDEIKEEECRLQVDEDNLSFDFKVRAKTLKIENRFFTLVIIKDISDDKRRQVLERIFFHDIVNTAGGINGIVELMKDATEDELNEYIGLIESSSETLLEEINAQKDLLAAETESLEIEYDRVNSLEILNAVLSVYKNHQVAKGKSIEVSEDTQPFDFMSDPRLLIRTIGNMSKNALEAEPKGMKVSLGAKLEDDQAVFWVNNPSVMPDFTRKQIFQRSFSTKGKGRGIGTYSIKILVENYLKGIVEFESTEKRGTIFLVRIPLKDGVLNT